MPTLQELGFEPTNLGAVVPADGCIWRSQPVCCFLSSELIAYAETRDFPASRTILSFYPLAIWHGIHSWSRRRRMATLARGLTRAEIWLSELIWRDFYFTVLHHSPRVVTDSFKPEYDSIRWQNDAGQFAAWCEGRTGYPIVDAAMRQLNQTGYMHNRLQ